MMKINNPILLSISIFLISAIWSNVVGQNIQAYDSTYKIDGKIYLASYEYYVNDGDTIYDGKFELSQQFENQEDIYEYLAVAGSFIENRADEDWKLTKGSFETTGDGYYKDYTYSYDVNGHEFMAIGKFLAGKKTGVWKLYDWEIRDSKIMDTTLIANINFEEDKAKGFFSLRIQNDILEGQLGEKELTQDVWAFYRVIEGDRILLKEWVFEGNTLSFMRLYRSDSVQEINIEFPYSAELSEEIIPLDDEFLEIIELKAKIFNEELLAKYQNEDKISELYFTLTDNFDLVDKTFSPITKTGIHPNIMTKLMSSPLNENEQQNLENIRKNNVNNQTKINKILSNPQLNISSISSIKLAQLKNVLQKINQHFILPTSDIITLYENQKLRFFNRDQLINHKIKLNSNSSINSVFKKDTLSNDYKFINDLSFLSNEKRSNLSKLSSLATVLEKEIEYLEENIQEYLSEVQQEEKLVELEEALLSKYEETKYLADSLITGEHDNFAGIDVADAIIDFVDAELAVYSNLPTPEDKIKAIEVLINCFIQTEDLIYTIHNAPESIYKINDAYTKEVFNPYTFTNMEEKAKPPIYKAFNRMLLPGIFQNMEKLNCNNMSAFQANFKILYEAMIKVLNEDNTNRMERKVKRAKTAEKAAEILNMELSF
ncbi:hypothetical protein [Marivirga harenae]|uniref:hypothetical protein n=1 Tax=Marivirga harenae TaxID=2010992 RepID=UPI0026DF9C3D|nr:hypothetical protein [Marivirga harenae]WKV12116.1 hypothetical protein Q3Y49_18120 [Marivirga harenae]